MYCTQCGNKNPEGAKFCAQCGTALGGQADATTGMLPTSIEDLAPDASPRVDDGAIREELSPGTALLISVRGPNVGARFLLDKAVVTVGRHPDSDIFLDDITVSRRHAEFRRSDTTFDVVDAGSLNGTYINGTRSDEKSLVHGDDVQVGKFRLQAIIPEPSSHSAGILDATDPADPEEE